MAKPATAVSTKAKVNLPVDVNNMFAAEVAGVSSRIHQGAGGEYIKASDGQFELPDGRKFPQLDAIVVEFNVGKTLFGKWHPDPAKRGGLLCAAIGTDPTDLKPASTVPHPVNADCSSCPKNQWGSKGLADGTDSKGKECGDVRNYVVMEMVDGEAKLYQGRCSSTATKYFDKHVMAVASTYARPIRGVLTRLGWDANNNKVQMFSDLGPADNSMVMEAQGKLEEARRMLSVEPTFKVEEAANDESAKAPAKRANAKR